MHSNVFVISKAGKLIKRLLSRPKDFTYLELKTLLFHLGYEEIQGAGSSKEEHKIKLHKPHPGDILKMYQVDLIIEELAVRGLIEKD